MNQTARNVNVEVVDILYAIALGAGFTIGIYDFKERLIALEVFTAAETGQSFCRITLAFLVIIASWLHYKRHMVAGRTYPSPEFLSDILIVLIYMLLFIFVEAPAAYDLVMTAIWLLYALARLAYWPQDYLYFLFGLGFAAVFAALVAGSLMNLSRVWERVQLAVAAGLVVGYRPLDGACQKRLYGREAP